MVYNQNTKRFKFNDKKAVEVLLYITSYINDLYKALKILYYADKYHIHKYGRFINGDKYIAMKDGPVPSQSYDLIKIARGDSLIYDEKISSLFKIQGNEIIPQRPADLSLISETDIECLNQSIKENRELTFKQLRKKSHDKTYKKTNDEIPLELILVDDKNRKEILDYLENMY